MPLWRHRTVKTPLTIAQLFLIIGGVVGLLSGCGTVALSLAWEPGDRGGGSDPHPLIGPPADGGGGGGGAEGSTLPMFLDAALLSLGGFVIVAGLILIGVFLAMRVRSKRSPI